MNTSEQPDLTRLNNALQRCKAFGLYFARCNNHVLRTELVTTLKESLAAPIIELTLNPDNDIYIDAQMAQVLENAPDNAVVFIYDIEKLFHIENRHVIAELNWRRGFYGRMNHPVVFWLPEFLLVELFQNAPDFMDWRSGVYEFNLSQAEQQNLMTDTWQTASENFVDQLTLAEKQRWIINLRNLLSEIDEQGNSITKANLLNRLGQLYDSLANYDAALLCYQQALKIVQNIGDKKSEGAALNNISQICQIKGDYDTALNYLTQVLKIDQELDNKKGKGVTLNNISLAYRSKDDYDTALRYLNDSLKITQDFGDKQGEGTTLSNISSIAHAKGDYDTALHYSMQALQIAQDISDKKGEGTTLNNISQIYDAKGNYDTALGYLTESLKISQDIGDKYGIGITFNNISSIYRDKGDYDTALHYINDSLKISQDIGDKAGECHALFNIGHIHLQNAQLEQAMATWLQAYKIAKQIDLAQVLTALENLAKQRGEDGLAYWEALSQATSTAR